MKAWKKTLVFIWSILLLAGTAQANGSSERLYPPSSVTGSSVPPAVSVNDDGSVAIAGTVQHATGGKTGVSSTTRKGKRSLHKAPRTSRIATPPTG